MLIYRSIERQQTPKAIGVPRREERLVKTNTHLEIVKVMLEFHVLSLGVAICVKRIAVPRPRPVSVHRLPNERFDCRCDQR